jgi:hypothetical protein
VLSNRALLAPPPVGDEAHVNAAANLALEATFDVQQVLLPTCGASSSVAHMSGLRVLMGAC